MNTVILLAAGLGRRFGGETVKTIVEYAGKPIFIHALDAFVDHSAFVELIVVGRADLLDTYHALIEGYLQGRPEIFRQSVPVDSRTERDNLNVLTRVIQITWNEPSGAEKVKRILVVAGGDQRIDSLQCGLAASQYAGQDPDGLIAIHDGARPFLRRPTIDSLVERLTSDSEVDAALPALDLFDTIKLVTDGQVKHTVDRRNYVAAQTPQLIRRGALDKALQHWAQSGCPVVTDDVQLIEQMGGRVAYINGDPRNKKVTVQDDLVSENIQRNNDVKGDDIMGHEALSDELKPRYLPRAGIGYDVHQLASGRDLILGGVSIPHECGLDGHSDADVLAHAISDALLGACAMGDIGKHFPPSDPAFKGADSILLLKQLCKKIKDQGFDIGNIDAVLACERPKLAGHIPAIRQRLAEATNLGAGRVSVKATTTESLGFEGREEGISCYATCMVFERIDPK